MKDNKIREKRIGRNKELKEPHTHKTENRERKIRRYGQYDKLVCVYWVVLQQFIAT